MIVITRITKVLLLLALMVPMSGTVRAQAVDEDFKAFVERFVTDCEFQKSRVVFPVEALLHEEDTVRVVMVDEKDWGDCVPFSEYKLMIGSSITDGVTVLIVQVEDTGVWVEYRFGLVDNKWFLQRVEDYSM